MSNDSTTMLMSRCGYFSSRYSFTCIVTLVTRERLQDFTRVVRPLWDKHLSVVSRLNPYIDRGSAWGENKVPE